MTSIAGLIQLLVAGAFLISLLLTPSFLTILFTSRNFEIVLSIGYWISAAGASFPYVLGLLLFLLIYPFTKAPPKGAMAGLWFIVIGLGMMCIQSVRFVLKLNKGEDPSFWDAVVFSSWPYVIILALYGLAILGNIYSNWRGGSNVP